MSQMVKTWQSYVDLCVSVDESRSVSEHMFNILTI